MKKQQGFSLTILLVILLIAVVGASVVYVQTQNEESSNASDSTTSTTQNTDSKSKEQTPVQSSTADSAATANDQYVTIAEWGVKLRVGAYADKITVSKPTTGTARSDIKLSVKPEFDEYADCTTEVMITRLKDVSDFDNPPKMKLGDYYYYNSGASECGGAKPSGNKNTVKLSELTAYFKDIVVVSQ